MLRFLEPLTSEGLCVLRILSSRGSNIALLMMAKRLRPPYLVPTPPTFSADGSVIHLY